MKNKFAYFSFIFLTVLFLPYTAHAELLGGITVNFEKLLGAAAALQELSDSIIDMTEQINIASSKMMKFGDMLICNSFHGSAAEISFGVLGIDIVTLRLVAINIFLSGIILYVIGFFIMMIASFYMFDIAFNLTIGITLLPLALALWPFGVTRDKLKLVIESILYYVGLFIFLPLGVLIANVCVSTVVEEAFGESIIEVFDNDKADIIKAHFGIFRATFAKVLLCYIVAIKIIPLMAGEFCEHFFGGALVGNPMSNRMSQISKLAARPFKKVGQYGKNAVQHQTGKGIENFGKKHSNSILGRAMARYGKGLANTRRRR